MFRSTPGPFPGAIPFGPKRAALAAVIATAVSLWLLTAPALAAPANDNFANRVLVLADAPATVGSLVGSTYEPGEAAATGTEDFGLQDWGTVWYAYTPANNVSATIRAAGRNGFQSKLQVFTGTGYSDLVRVSGNPPSSCPGGDFPFQNGGCETFAASAGTTYLIQVINHNFGGSGETFDLTVTESGVGSISGRVLSETNAPLTGVCVKSYTAAGAFHAQATTAANGTYTVAAPSGSDRVEFSDCSGTTPVFTEWHNDKASFATADAINVPPGGNTNLGDTKVQRGSRISGTVIADGGGAIENVCVLFFDAATGVGVANDRTEADGSYTKLLPAGSYKLQYLDCQSPRVYAAEWFDDQALPSAATTVELEPGEVFDADAGLAVGGSISGTFTYVDPDGEDTCIEAHPAGGDGTIPSGTTTTDAGDTSYELSGLAAGSYRIKMYECTGATPGPAVWHPLHHSFAFGQLVTVTSGGTTDVPLSFGDATSVGVHVQSSGATPLAGVCVDVYDSEAATLLLGSATTNAGGDAAVSGLAAGGYKLKFTDCGAGFDGPVWYATKSGFAAADVLSLGWPQSPQDFPTVNQVLQTRLADATPPDLPTLDSTNPASGANENDPEVIGTAEPGSVVRLFTDPGCTTPVGASTPAGDFASPGITVRVTDNSATTFYATATDAAGNASACSTDSITYAEITPSSPPDDDSACTAARAKLASAEKLKAKAVSAVKSAVAKDKPRRKIAKLKRRSKAAGKAVKKAASEVAGACS